MAKTYRVYHFTNPLMWFHLAFGNVPKQVFRHEYSLVANVSTHSLEEVFELTNSRGDHPWWQNHSSSVQPTEGKHRSTSVDDLIAEVQETGETLFLIMSQGFEQRTWCETV